MKSPVLIRRVSGDSMKPAYKHGQLILASGWFLNIRPGRVFVFDHNGKEKLKRVVRLQNNKAWVVGDNPSRSTDSRHFGAIELSTFKARVIYPRA